MEEIIENNFHLTDGEFDQVINESLTPEMEDNILVNLKPESYENEK
jgi:hypothetical protein